ncbi:LAFA_0G03334g1_1 [Lachancea sp. 'fantastica']|nr:LAFA_0G03334g1_1 [Lachancea sp. 'fantastica']
MTILKKRRLDSDENEVNKLIKCSITTPKPMQERKFTNFVNEAPHELICAILILLDRKDTIALASTSKTMRNRLRPYVFDQIKCSWHDLTNYWNFSDNLQAPIKCPALVETMRISLSCSKNEWAFPFHVLFDHNSPLTNLKSLVLPTSGSTNFFKYCQEAPRLLKLRITADRNNSEFSLEHIRNFPELQELALSNFHIEDHEDAEFDTCPRLKNIALTNCTWSYPFNIENLGKDKITTLHLIYSNSFIMSERFRYFLSCPGFTNLEELSVVNYENNLRLTISVQIMALIKAIPTLKKLKLTGNISDEALLRPTESRDPSHTNVVAVQDVKIFYSSFLREIG